MKLAVAFFLGFATGFTLAVGWLYLDAASDGFESEGYSEVTFA